MSALERHREIVEKYAPKKKVEIMTKISKQQAKWLAIAEIEKRLGARDLDFLCQLNLVNVLELRDLVCGKVKDGGRE